MEILLATFSISLIGMVGMIFARFSHIKEMSHEQIALKIRTTKSLRKIFYKYIISPLVDLWHLVIKIKFYKTTEKSARKFRIFVLKTERILFRFTDYVRGKHVVEKNGNHSEYWHNINEFKNGLNKDENKPL